MTVEAGDVLFTPTSIASFWLVAFTTVVMAVAIGVAFAVVVAVVVVLLVNSSSTISLPDVHQR
jgi:MFS superfamily sulfate permease-like transporter